MLLALGFALGLGVADASAALLAAGKTAYETYCAACHGRDLAGGANAPTLRGAGAAALDFWMVTGRMPAAVPWLQVAHRGAQLRPADIAAIEAYVTAVAPGGTPIPDVTTDGNLERGRSLFAQNCQACHGIGGGGASIGGNAWAPDLHLASIVQVAEAIRIGSGQHAQIRHGSTQCAGTRRRRHVRVVARRGHRNSGRSAGEQRTRSRRPFRVARGRGARVRRVCIFAAEARTKRRRRFTERLPEQIAAVACIMTPSASILRRVQLPSCR